MQKQLYKKISELIIWHRKQAGLSQKGLADLADVGKTVIYDLEHGKETVRLSTLIPVLEVLGIQLQFDSPLMDLFEEQYHEKS